MTLLALDLLPSKGSACQLRTARDPQTVARYAEAYADGVKMPPVVVFRETVDGHTVHHLADGHHRAAGARKAGLAEIEADVREGSHRDAVLFAAGANGQHGLPLSTDDKWAIVATVLADAEWVTWSDRQISEHCHVSASLVAKVRKKTGTSSATRKGKDGATRSLPTKKKKIEAPAGAEAGPSAPTEPPAAPPAPAAEPEEITTAALTAPAPAQEPPKPVRPPKQRPLAERRADWLRATLADRIEAAHSFAGSNGEQAALILLCGADTDVEGVWSEIYVQKASHGLHTTLCRNVAEDLRNGQAHRLPDWRTLARLFGVDYEALSITADRSIPE
jgi:hypothetical protein